MKKKLFPYFFLTPYFVLLIGLELFPLLFSFFISLTKWNGVGEPLFVGITNYMRLIKDKNFFSSIQNTCAIILISIPLQLTIGFSLALIITKVLKKSKKFFQVLLFLPYLVTPVAIGVIFQILFEYNGGTINQILESLGMDPIYWLGNVGSSRFVIILMKVWRSYGYSMILFTSGLLAIPDDVYEAAEIDGAGVLKKTFYITIPMLKNVMKFVVIMTITAGFQLFDEPRTLFAEAGQPVGGPEGKLLTIVGNFYDVAFTRFEMGYGSAIGYGLFILMLFSTNIVNRLFREKEER
jgi:cellobiose transport system permease protein